MNVATALLMTRQRHPGSFYVVAALPRMMESLSFAAKEQSIRGSYHDKKLLPVLLPLPSPLAIPAQQHQFTRVQDRFFSTAKPPLVQSLLEDLDTATLDPETAERISELLEYKERHGDVHVPAGNSQFARLERERLEVSDELAQWVAEQRRLYQRHKSSKRPNAGFLTRILVLESIGFLWLERDSQWQRSFNRLEAYKKDHGTLAVDRNEDQQLWTWIDQQRKAYHNDKLSDTRLGLLNEIGFIFDVQEAKWWEFYDKLCTYKREYGDTHVPKNYEADLAFGAWVARQRRRYQIGLLPQARVVALDKIGFIWSVHGDAWEQNYQELRQFQAKHGHTQISKHDNPTLFHWADRQRQQLRELVNGSTSRAERADYISKVSALKELGFDLGESDIDRVNRLIDLQLKVDVHEEKWMENFRSLCAFKDRAGHFLIPSEFPENQELSNWVRHQRHLKKRGVMPRERVELLESVDFPWTAQVARWDVMYETLVRFHAEHGHTRVPSWNVQLCRWISQQKKVLKANTKAKHSGKQRVDRRLSALERLLVDNQFIDDDDD